MGRQHHYGTHSFKEGSINKDMRYLFEELEALRQNLKQRPVFFFLDYDGTLAPIAETPQEAFVSERTKKLLSELSKLPHCKLAIISGRALKDIKKIIGLKSVTYVGNHGLELEGPNIRFKIQVPSRFRLRIQHICEELKRKLSKIDGVLIEDKGLTLSLHYRLVNEKNTPFVKTAFQETVIVDKVKGALVVKTGKKVLEIRPAVPWDKGKVVLWLLARQHFALEESRIFPIYIGDDATDEDAFRALKKEGLTIFVGEPKTSHANYYLKNTEEVLEFLQQVYDLRRGQGSCQN